MQLFAAEDSGGLLGDSLDVAALCKARGWSRTQLIAALRRVAAAEGQRLPEDESLKRMLRLWANGTRTPSNFYSTLLARAFGVAQVDSKPEPTEEFLELLDRAESSVDQRLVEALEAQTQSLRVLDRRIGAHRLLSQALAHWRNVADLLQWSPLGPTHQELAAVGAEAAALAGWQALDLGRPKQSWRLHNEARALAREAEDPAITAHVTAQQAYALLDAGRTKQAVAQFEAARHSAITKVPNTVRAWLAAAEAEARAIAGDCDGAVRLLDEAEEHLSTDDQVVPFIVLNPAHLARWRGSCLAKAGHPDAVGTLTRALDVLDPDFTRAAAGLHADLATANSVNGDRDAARHHAQLAARLSSTTGSTRQRRRVSALLDAESE